MSVVYLDHSATTPADPRVVEAMIPFLGGIYGNPSSLHTVGREARAAVLTARAQVAALIGARPEDIVFTASGTEADNLAILGSYEARESQDFALAVSAIEHPAVLAPARAVERRGAALEIVPVDGQGTVDPDRLALAFARRPAIALVSVMAANNVVGTLQALEDLGQVAHENGALFHTDAIQAAGKVAIDVRTLPVDMLSLLAHKLHGPKGVGALYLRPGVALHPIIHGGGQERGLRSATENVAAIVGFGKAAEIALAEGAAEADRLRVLRDHILAEVTRRLPNAYLLGHPSERLPGHLCLGFAGQEGEAIRLLMALDQEGIAVSSGSACSAHRVAEPSYVLQAMGLDAFQARGSLRVTLGRFTTAAEIERFLEVLPRVVGELRSISTRRFATS
ncbi:cysteine desulfurase NifS [Rhodospirillum rubrum]|nr:cysteine desulfurase NifS [Rhodospirillum rubrum]